MSKIRAVVFDLDDTLYPELSYNLSGFAAVSDWVETHLGISGFFEVIKTCWMDKNDGKVFNRALKSLGLSDDEQLVKKLVDVYRLHTPRIHLYDDACWILNELKGKILLGIITDGYVRTQQLKIKALDIEKLVDAIVLSDALGRDNWKPSKLPYLEMCARLKLDGESCMYVGDNPYKDFLAAKDLGWTTVRIDRGTGLYSGVRLSSEFEGQFLISNLSELLGFL
jgi:putative hydrolase of the HAD superfamily